MRFESKTWNSYNKEIPEDHFFYVRSCVRQNFWPGAEQTFLKILVEYLKKDVHIEAVHTTCTGIAYHGDIVPLETTMTVVARQFALMTEAGYENFVPSCITSFGLYHEVLEMWKHHPEVEEKIRTLLYKATGRTFNIPRHIIHPSDIIYNFRYEILKNARYKLINASTGLPLRCVDHVGCHYAKMFPEKGIGGAEFPKVLSGLIEAWGGEVIDYPERRSCCGFGFRQYLVKANRGYSLSCARRKFESMAPYKPDLIVTNCPGCPYFLDRWQYVISELEGKVYSDDGYGIPVLTYEELAGIILGFDPWEIGLQMHQVSVEPLLKKMGIEYDPDGKYKAKGQPINSRPAKPNVLKVM